MCDLTANEKISMEIDGKLATWARFAGFISVNGMFGDTSGQFQGQILPVGTIGDAAGQLVGQSMLVQHEDH
jgi:hypothetical protein